MEDAVLMRCRHLTEALWSAYTFLQRIVDEEQPSNPLWKDTLAASASVMRAIREWGEDDAGVSGRAGYL
jgi:hypothetical protein